MLRHAFECFLGQGHVGIVPANVEGIILPRNGETMTRMWHCVAEFSGQAQEASWQDI